MRCPTCAEPIDDIDYPTAYPWSGCRCGEPTVEPLVLPVCNEAWFRKNKLRAGPRFHYPAKERNPPRSAPPTRGVSL